MLNLFENSSNTLYILLSLIIVLIIYLILISNWFKRVRLALILQGPPALPLIGNGLIPTDNEALLKLGTKCYEDYGPVVRIWLSFIPCFIINDPNDIQNVLGTQKNTDRAFFYKFMSNYLGNGLITSNGQKWKMNRKLLQPLFNIKILEVFLDTFSRGAASLVENLKEKQNAEAIKITNFINNSIMNIVCEAILGVPINEISSHDLLKHSPFRQGKIWTQDRMKRPWLMFDSFFKFTKDGKSERYQSVNMISIIKKLIDIRKENRQTNGNKAGRTSYLDLILDVAEEHEEFTYDDVVNELCTLIFAGQDSVSTSIAFCLYFLAKHKSIQDRVFEELKTIFQDSKRNPNMNDLNEMKYLEQCIKETLRLTPTVPITVKNLTKPLPVGKHVLPVGSLVIISPFITHHLAHIYPEPDSFNPDRFTSDEIQKRHPFAFIPFSAGPRNCIGYKFALLELKTVISTVIRNFELSLKSDYQLNLIYSITLKAKGGIPLHLNPRSKKNFK